MLLWLTGRSGCGRVVQRDMGVVGDDLRHLAHCRCHRAVIVAGAQVGNHVAADIPNLAVGQDAFEAIANFNAVLVIGNGQEHESAPVGALPAHLPLVSSWSA